MLIGGRWLTSVWLLPLLLNEATLKIALLLVLLFSFPFLQIYLFIYLSLAALGLHCSVRAFSSCGEPGLLFIAVRRLLIVVASRVAKHRL